MADVSELVAGRGADFGAQMSIDVGCFLTKCGLRQFTLDTIPPDLWSFRQRLLLEEMVEIGVAYINNDRISFLDGLVDFAYVVTGTAWLCGLSPLTSLSRQPAIGEPHLPEVMAMIHFCDELHRRLFMFWTSWQHGTRERFSSLSVSSVVRVRDMAVRHGFPFSQAWDIVHEANMRKERSEAPPSARRGGAYDMLKPNGWKPPDLRALVERPPSEAVKGLLDEPSGRKVDHGTYLPSNRPRGFA